MLSPVRQKALPAEPAEADSDRLPVKKSQRPTDFELEFLMSGLDASPFSKPFQAPESQFSLLPQGTSGGQGSLDLKQGLQAGAEKKDFLEKQAAQKLEGFSVTPQSLQASPSESSFQAKELMKRSAIHAADREEFDDRQTLASAGIDPEIPFELREIVEWHPGAEAENHSSIKHDSKGSLYGILSGEEFVSAHPLSEAKRLGHDHDALVGGMDTALSNWDPTVGFGPQRKEQKDWTQSLSEGEGRSTSKLTGFKGRSAAESMEDHGVPFESFGLEEEMRDHSPIEGTSKKSREGSLFSSIDLLEAGTSKQGARVDFPSQLEESASVLPGNGSPSRVSAENLMRVSGAIQQLSRNGGGELRIRLNPENLGELHLRVKTDGVGVGLQIHASDEKARKMIEEGLGSLKESLSARNLVLTHIDLSVIGSSTAQGENLDFKENSSQSHSRGQAANHDFTSGSHSNLHSGLNSGFNQQSRQSRDWLANELNVGIQSQPLARQMRANSSVNAGVKTFRARASSSPSGRLDVIA